LVVAEAGAERVGGASRNRGVAEIVILVLGLGRPVRGEQIFEARADGVAVLAVARGGEGGRYTADGHADIVAVTPGVTTLGVEQRRAPGVAEAAGHRADLVG